MSNITSPCILVCSIDLKTGYCFGCGRTSTEIANWISMSRTERHDVMQELPSRLTTIEKKPRRITKRRRIAKKSDIANNESTPL